MHIGSLQYNRNWFFYDFKNYSKILLKTQSYGFSLLVINCPDFVKNGSKRNLHNFFWCIYMSLCCISSLSQFQLKLYFKSYSKSWSNTQSCVYSLWAFSKFHQNGSQKNLHFYLIDIHNLMSFIKFEVILIKFGFFTNFKSYFKIQQKIIIIVQSISPKIAPRIFKKIIFIV